MTILLSLALTVATGLLLVPMTVLLLEVVVGCFAKNRLETDKEILDRGSVAVLIPAHNEEHGIAPTLRDVALQLEAGDRLVVVADNCTDGTAAVAVAAGADVTERSNPADIGKGYALDWGLNFLAAAPPCTVIIIDADCRLEPGAISSLAHMSRTTGRPVQSLYMMTSPSSAGISQQVAEFAWCVKNQVRPLGLRAMGLPCQLMGTGMAFPWEVIRTANLRNGYIVEDLKLGLELAEAGHPTFFFPNAVVASTFPASIEGARSQRERWEHGHLGLIATDAFRLLFKGVLNGKSDLIAISLDLLVPPLSLLGLIVIAMCIVSGAAIFIGASAIPFYLACTAFMMILVATLLSWWRFAKTILPLKSLASIPFYLAAKLPLYLKVVLGRKVSTWIRADRSSAE